MGEGLQAGRLEVPVVADLAGFAAKLRAEVESAAEGLSAKIKVEINAKGLRKQLKKAVEEASKGVTAKIKVKVDEERFRTELQALRRRLDDDDIRIPVRANGDGDGSRRDGLIGGLRTLIGDAQGEANRRPVNLPVRARMPGGRGALIGSILTLLEPAVSLIAQYGAGLTALVSAASPAVGVLGAIPGLIAAAGTAAIGTKVAFNGFGDALKETLKIQQMHAAGTKVTKAEQEKLTQATSNLSASARKTVKDVAAIQPAWAKVRKAVSGRFFSQIDDDIKPLTKSTFPLLKSMLGDSAAQMGKLADRGAQFMKSGIFRRDFKTIAGTNSRVIGHMTDGVANLGHASLDFLVATGPFVERVSRAGERMTQWMRATVQAGRETGSLARFMDHAGDAAGQLGRATGSLIKGFGGMGRAAMDTGQSMLDGLEGTMKRFERYANSGRGQKAMKQMFSDTAPAFHEVNLLFGDMMRGIGRTMKDGGVVDLVRQIRLQLMPALGTFFNSLGHSVGPALIAVISNIAEAVGHLSAAGSGLGVLLSAFNGFLHAVNAVMTAVPALNTAVAVLLGTMLALKVVSSITNSLRTFGTSMRGAATSARGLGTTLRGTTTSTGTNLSLWGRMSGVYTRVSSSGNRLTGTLRGIGAANRVASRAMGGMTAALGGPLGIALTGITIGLGLYASRQEEAARATAAHKERVDALSEALVASGGIIDANVRAQAAQMLQDVELANGKGKLVDVMAKAGVGLGELTSAYLEQGTSLDELAKKLQVVEDSHPEYGQTVNSGYVGLDKTGEAAHRARLALSGVKGELTEVQTKNKAVADAANEAGTKGVSSYDRLQVAVTNFGDKTKSADERVNSLKRALDQLNGNSQSFHDAEAQLNSVMLQIDDTMKENIDKADGWGRALVGNDKLVDTSTKNGQNLNSHLQELRDSMLAVTTSAIESAEQGQMPMSEAMDKSTKAMESARKKALQLAADMHIPKDQAKALVDQMGFVPDTVTTLVTAKGIPEATAEILGLRTKLEGIKPGKHITVSAPTKEARQQLEDLGFKVKTLKGKKVSITAPTKGARVDIAALATDIANAPNKKKVTVQAIIKQAAGDLKNVQQKVAGLPKGKSIEVKTPTKVAQKALTDLGYKIKTVDGSHGKTVRITAPNKGPIAQVQAIQSKINGLTGKTVHVTVKYSTLGQPYVSKKADGGILKFANGGINRMAGRVKAFAAGAEQHIAQIAKAGEMRLWAEPETYPGEAYIPLAPGKRKRSEQILDTVAKFFGGAVVYPQRAVSAFANGGIRTSGRSTVHARGAATQAAAPLVGGDLNVNVGAVASTGSALEDAMFELRRIRLGGTP